MGRGWVVGIALGAALVGCGLDFVVAIEPEPAPSATTSTSRPPPPPPPKDAAVDAAPPVDAADAGPNPDDVSVSYVLASGKLYSFTVPGHTFVALTSTACPYSGEVAVFDDGTVYVAGDYVLTKWTPDVGCTEVARSNVQLPASLATAIVAGKEELVGYVGMQFVSIDRTTAARTILTSDALVNVGFPGDLTRLGRPPLRHHQRLRSQVRGRLRLRGRGRARRAPARASVEAEHGPVHRPLALRRQAARVRLREGHRDRPGYARGGHRGGDRAVLVVPVGCGGAGLPDSPLRPVFLGKNP